MEGYKKEFHHGEIDNIQINDDLAEYVDETKAVGDAGMAEIGGGGMTTEAAGDQTAAIGVGGVVEVPWKNDMMQLKQELKEMIREMIGEMIGESSSSKRYARKG